MYRHAGGLIRFEWERTACSQIRAVMLKILTGGPFRIPIARANRIGGRMHRIGTPIGDTPVVGQSGNQMMHISPRSVVFRMSRRCELLFLNGVSARRERVNWERRIVLVGGQGDGGETCSKAGWTSGAKPMYGRDEVESLRPDASLTMSDAARYLRARKLLSAPGRVSARIRAMRLKSPRRRAAAAL